ncbi:hypothetical protein N7533_008357 [Penicillium manginii]|uniref:uncharacterized protein n=1 Tax=Penicillium manginii TaxID=203109 RepID=UPI002549214F|nr:uncharacterized protein N7533_008357 [Penicillium manginii]KAJ5751329.1 hypothetical protein N7533_008357 [Penicillium manginii]
MFEQSAQSGGRRTYYVHSVDVHTVLRTLELIYLGAYSYHLEKTEIPDSERLLIDVSVYHLCKAWQLPVDFQSIAFSRYKEAVFSQGYDPGQLLDSLQPMRTPLVDGISQEDIFPGKLLNALLSKGELEEDRLVIFAVYEARRAI